MMHDRLPCVFSKVVRSNLHRYCLYMTSWHVHHDYIKACRIFFTFAHVRHAPTPLPLYFLLKQWVNFVLCKFGLLDIAVLCKAGILPLYVFCGFSPFILRSLPWQLASVVWGCINWRVGLNSRQPFDCLFVKGLWKAGCSHRSYGWYFS